MDIVGPLPTTNRGNKYLLTFQDAFSKYPEAIPIKDQTSKTIARKFTTEIICKHGTPKVLVTDQGKNFMSDLFTEVCKLLNIKKLNTTAFHPQANGQVERSHRTLMNYLSHYVNSDQTDWDDWIPFALFAYRATPHSVTGFSPFLIVHGREANLPSEIVFDNTEPEKDLSEEDYVQEIVLRLKSVFQTAKEKIMQSKEKSKSRYDMKSAEKTFKPGEFVLLHDSTVKRGRSRKLKRPWIGPYKILEQKSNVNYAIKRGRKTCIVHSDRLKPFRLRTID